MKYFVIVCVLFSAAQAKVLPDYLSDLVCHKSDPNFEQCLLDGLEKARPRLIKGIPETNWPALDPFELPLMTVDRTLNDLISIKAVLRNIKMIGAKDFILDSFKADPKNLTSEIRYTLPFVSLEMDYDVNGQILIIPLKSKGHVKGNFSDTQMYVKGSLKTIDKDGVKYFRVDKMTMKARVGDGHVQVRAANPDLQFGADLIANFYNDNPRRFMDAVNPIMIETAVELYRVVMDQLLGTIPAKELLPE